MWHPTQEIGISISWIHVVFIHQSLAGMQKCHAAATYKNMYIRSVQHCDCLTTSPSAQCRLLLLAMQAFVQKLAVCLLDVDRNPDSPMLEQLNNWTAEATCFVSL